MAGVGFLEVDWGMEMSHSTFVWIKTWDGGRGGEKGAGRKWSCHSAQPSGRGGQYRMMGDREPHRVQDEVNGRG